MGIRRDLSVKFMDFTYDGQHYNMSVVEVAKFFEVPYDMVTKRWSRGVKYQEIADIAAKTGGHQPRVRALKHKILYSRRLV